MAELTMASVLAAYNHSLEALADGLYGALVEGEFAVSQERVPVEFEDLKRTGYISPPIIQGSVITTVISYGEPEDDTGIYAIVQHERTDYNHPNGGQAKYLESAVLEGQASLLQRIADRAGKTPQIASP